MPRSAMLAALVLILGAALARAAGPIAVDRIEPPSWWPSRSASTITLLVEGSGLKGATVSASRPDLTIGRVESPSEGAHLFVDLTIAAGAEAGPVTLTFEAGGAKVERRWTIVPRSTHTPVPLGSDDVIYLVMPDRFANGNPANDSAEMAEPMLHRADPHAYHGGDFAGLKARLPYLKDLGVTAIWLTPVYKSAPAWFHTKVDGRPRKYADFQSL